ncbi:MAG: metallophosphoesterase family protein [Lentisphaeria bacterium]|nr:metallophosphoesterase family protein [Lentisphaeria bacterium]
MPRYAVLSDIHGNLEALQEVLTKCRELEIDSYISLGDVVGYNANPKECLEIVRKLPLTASVKGNHDEYASSGGSEILGFNQNARIAIQWTASQLSQDERSWLGAQNYRAQISPQGITVVHATLDTPENWGYIFDAHHAADNFSYQWTALCFCGHSHVPVAFCKKPIASGSERSIDSLSEWLYNSRDENKNTDFSTSDELPVTYKNGHKYLFNIGSIGQPRNGDPRASFAVVDTDEKVVTRFRIPYDVETVQKKVLAAGLPERLARRLASGN